MAGGLDPIGINRLCFLTVASETHGEPPKAKILKKEIKSLWEIYFTWRHTNLLHGKTQTDEGLLCRKTNETQ